MNGILNPQFRDDQPLYYLWTGKEPLTSRRNGKNLLFEAYTSAGGTGFEGCKLKRVMKRSSLIIMIMILATAAFGQNLNSLSKKEQRKLIREEEKRIAAEESARYAEILEQMVKSATFVLEADMLFDRYGRSTPVTPTINFILVDSLKGVVQIGNSFLLGYNGVGGVTVDGTVSDYEFSKNEKRGNYTIRYNLRSSMGFYTIGVNISPGGRADATVSGNYSGSIRYSGRIVHPARSKIFKGSSI
jgi:hypothetical protein